MSKPSLHVVVHHRFDPDKLYDNTWDDDLLRLKKFETTTEVADECENARLQNAWVYVHRCALAPFHPTIACRGKVADITCQPGNRPYIALDHLDVIDKRALMRPPEGHNHYYCDIPSWTDR